MTHTGQNVTQVLPDGDAKAPAGFDDGKEGRRFRPGLADTSIQRLAELTPAAWAAASR
jgi:hypothetical protein